MRALHFIEILIKSMQVINVEFVAGRIVKLIKVGSRRETTNITEIRFEFLRLPQMLHQLMSNMMDVHNWPSTLGHSAPGYLPELCSQLIRV